MSNDEEKTDEAALYVDSVLANSANADWPSRLRKHSERGCLELVHFGIQDLGRRRIQTRTQTGRLVHISLGREQSLFDGAILWYDENLAVVVAVQEQSELRMTATNIADALALGYLAGNMHWTVRFQGPTLRVVLESDATDYLKRIGELGLSEGIKVER